MHYEGAIQKGATPAQALATAQSAEAMQERAIERMLAGGDAGPFHATSADSPSDEMSAAPASANAVMDALNQDKPDSGTASRTGSSADPLLGTTTDKLSPYIQRAPASSQLTEYIRSPDLSTDQSQSNAPDPIDLAFEVGGNASDAVGLLFGAIDRKMLNGGVSFSMNTWSKSHWPIDDMRLVFAEPGRFHPWLATDTTFHYGSFADEAAYSWDFSGTKTGRMLAGTFDAVGPLMAIGEALKTLNSEDPNQSASDKAAARFRDVGKAGVETGLWLMPLLIKGTNWAGWAFSAADLAVSYGVDDYVPKTGPSAGEHTKGWAAVWHINADQRAAIWDMSPELYRKVYGKN